MKKKLLTLEQLREMLKTTVLQLLLAVSIIGVSSARDNTLFPEKENFSINKDELLASKKVSGTVQDDAGIGIPGVSVAIKGTTQGTVTDANGKFELEVPDDKTILVFSSIGYLKTEMVVGNNETFAITLKTDEQALSEVVVVGYGTQEKVNLTGSVGVVSGKALQNRPISTVGEACKVLFLTLILRYAMVTQLPQLISTSEVMNLLMGVRHSSWLMACQWI
jgi:hypothetical protein